MTRYLTIRSDAEYGRSTPVGPLVEFLRTLSGVVQAGPQEFRNAPDSPWVSLCFAAADASGCYAVVGTLPATVNVVELVCGDGDDSWYESLAQRVASFLRWEAVDEHSGLTIQSSG